MNFNWGNGFGDPNVGADLFSVRWTGRVTPRFSETYRFYTNCDDGSRLWINNVLLVDNWIDQGPVEKSGTITLTAGTRLRPPHGVLRPRRRRARPAALEQPVPAQADCST